MPTFVHGKNSKVLVGAYDLSGSFKEYTGSTNIDMAETSVFGNTNKTYIQGLGDSNISLNGLFSGGANEVDDVLGTALSSTTTLPVTICPNGYSTIGAAGFGLGAQLASYEINGSIGDVVSVSSQFQSKENTGGKSGKMLTSNASISATGNNTAVDSGVTSTTNGGYALLHVPVNTRDGAVTFVVADSADNVSFATIGTFTATVASTVTSEYLAISGTIRRYVRLSYTFAGTTGAVTPHCLFVRL